jgi:hypothetical protein
MKNRIKVILILLVSVLLIVFQIINRRNIKTNPTLEPSDSVETEITPINKVVDDSLIENPPYNKFGERTDGGITEDINYEDTGNYIPN